MQFIVDSNKPVAQAATDLAKAVAAHGFGVLHVYDLKQTLASKGVELTERMPDFRRLQPTAGKQGLDRTT